MTDAFAESTALKTATHKPPTKNDKTNDGRFTSTSFDSAEILSSKMRCLFFKYCGQCNLVVLVIKPVIDVL